MKQEERTRQSVELIINAAIPEFVTKGYENAVVNDICRNNGISKGRLFHHFVSKDVLYIACCKYIVELFVEHCDKFIPQEGKSLQENLHDYVCHRSIFFLRKKGGADLLWAVMKNDIPKFRTEIGEIYDLCKNENDKVLDRINKCSDGPLGEIASKILASMFSVALSYNVMNCMLGNDVYSLSQARQKQIFEDNVVVFDTIMDGLLFGLYPRDANERSRMNIDRDRVDEIFSNLQI